VIEQMTVKKELPIPEDTSIFFPADLDLLSDRSFLVLSTFGPQSFSFVSAKGDSYPLPTVRLQEVEPGRRFVGSSLAKLHVSVKSVSACAADWNYVLKNKEARFDKKERAAVHRMYVFQESPANKIFRKLAECIALDMKAEGEEKREAKVGEKRKREEPQTKFTSFDDFFSTI
jgi:hypothetical protein